MIDTQSVDPIRRRPRRLRKTQAVRDLVAETDVALRNLIVPHFVLPDQRGYEAIESMPGIARLGIDDLTKKVERDLEGGLRTVLLFGVSRADAKDPEGSASADPEGAVPRAVSALKSRFGDDLTVMTDVCLCAYTDHGHCGLLRDGRIENDASLAPLARMALAHATAGVDFVAPSDMMDGRVAAIRNALDADGMSEVGIMSYAVKYASAYYGPFRDAAMSSPGEGDRKSYQMDLRNGSEALREAELDVEEGADMVMVKPALAYLDVVRRVKDRTRLPLVVYNVSGEYAAVKAAASNGWLDEAAIVRENLLAMRRAGADAIVTYHASEAASGGWL